MLFCFRLHCEESVFHETSEDVNFLSKEAGGGFLQEKITGNVSLILYFCVVYTCMYSFAMS